MNHGRVDAGPVILDVREGFVVRPACLQRRVRRPVRQIEKERMVAVRLDHAHGFVGVVVRQVALRLELARAVELRRITHGRPDHFVDAAEVQLGVYHGVRVRRQIQTTDHVQAVVEALLFGAHLADAAKMPFADMRGAIARTPHRLRQGDFVRRHTEFLDCRHFRREVMVNHRLQRCRIARLHPVEDRHPDAEERRELEAEAGGIASGHQCRTRWRADGVGGIAIGERRARGGNRINVRRRRRTVGHRRAAVQGDVVEAEIVGQNQHHVGWPFAGRRGWPCGPLLPGNGPMGRNRITDVGDDGRKRHQQVQPIGVGEDRQHRYKNEHRADLLHRPLLHRPSRLDGANCRYDRRHG